jgi:serine/threonine-protein kinase
LIRRGLDDDTGTKLSPATVDAGVLATLAASFGPIRPIMLRDTDPETAPGPLVRPSSAEMPAADDRHGRYQLLGEIARGGMGAILKGRDVDLGRDMAVKVLLEAHRSRPEMVRRFVEEAQIGGQLQHPGIVPVYELGTFADRRPYFTMKLVKGRTLADLLAGRDSLADDMPRFLSIFEQVCQTVAYAHARGVIHRDLKPGNIMVGGFGEVQVMDWGVAKVLARGDEGDEDLLPTMSESTVSTIRTMRSGSDVEVSQAGSVLGTPSYMAPEQARGEVDRVDERTDVFGLGSILCEILTGRPAFTGRTSVEIQRKAAAGDLAETIKRLDACGADPELVSLARVCMAARPEDRPRTAGEVARKLTAYRAGVQERLRAAELARVAQEAKAEEARRTALAAEARARAERRARRLTAGLAASLLAMTTLGGLTLTYLLHQRQARAAAVDRLLDRASALLDQARAGPDDPAGWRKALEAIQQVEDNPGGLAAQALPRLAPIRAAAETGLRAAERDAALRQALIAVRADEQEGGPEALDAGYAAAFRAAELDIDVLGVAEASARLRRRPAAILIELVAYLDHWAGVRRLARLRAAKWRTPLDVAQAADTDEYRNRLRALLAADDLKAQAAKLRALAHEPRAGELPAGTAVLLAWGLEAVRDRKTAVSLLRKAADRHPGDVWVNFALAKALDRIRPPVREEALRYYTAARALRPEMAHDLAHMLDAIGRADQAEAIFRGDVARRPDARNLRCLGTCLLKIGRGDEARAVLRRAVLAYRDAIRQQPDYERAHYNLGVALTDLGRPAEAEAEFRTAIRLQSDNAQAYLYLSSVLADLGRLTEAEAGYRTAIRLQPEFCDAAYYNFATVLEAQGRLDDAEAAYREALRLNPEFPDAHCNLGRLLLRSGRYAEALEERRRGHELGSRRADWRYPSGEWVREAERFVALDARLPAVLKGHDRPAHTAERVTFAQLCYSRKLNAAAARLYAEALGADPRLRDDRQAGHTYNAACCAALAGCGQGKDDPPTDYRTLAKLRGQALDWLRDELAAWSKLLDGGTPDAPARVQQALAHWNADSDLAGLRDPTSLVKLPEVEQRACRALWSEVGAVLAKARGGASQ